MEQWVKDIANQAKKTYGSIEIKTKNGNHYLYKATSIYKQNKKYPQKITKEYIGKITPQGLIPTKTKERTLHEHTNSILLSTILDEITPQLQKKLSQQLARTLRPSHNKNHTQHPTKIHKRRLGKTLHQHQNKSHPKQKHPNTNPTLHRSRLESPKHLL